MGLSQKKLKLVKGKLTLKSKCISHMDKSSDLIPLEHPEEGDESQEIVVAYNLDAERVRWEQEGLNLPKLVEKAEELAAKVDEHHSSMENDDAPVLAEVDLGQVLDMWYRNLPTTYIPGSPLRLLVPFEDPRYPPESTGGEDHGTTELGDRYAMVISCSELSHEDRSFVAQVSQRLVGVLGVLHGRHLRAQQREECLADIQAYAQSVSITTGHSLVGACLYMIGKLKECLPRYWDLFVGMSHPGEDAMEVR